MLTIWMIWIQENDALWLFEAWDDDSTQENSAGWEAAKRKAYKDHHPENVRIIRTDVSYDKVRAAFNPVEV